ncbi:MAG: class I SAM-dependent methyltransferase [Planctomycetota bacterium]|jgi:ubiquinone/menaquinone biosynthesis C-methylase UbiE
MKLSRRILEKLDSRLVHRINEIYHNLENAYYDTRHDEILKSEPLFWKNSAERFVRRENEIVCLDFGTGTGFVPEIIGPYMKKGDSLICCDVSAEMLTVCEDKLTKMHLKCECSFHKIDDEALPVHDGSVDVITVNSVLHHIYDLNSFVAECERLLKPSGLMVVAHEPNRVRRLPLHGAVVRGLAGTVFRPKDVFFKIAERVPFMESLMRRVLSRISSGYRRRNAMLAEISRQLRDEKLLDFDLRGTEIQQMVDFQAQSGFDLQELLEGVFCNFELVESESYCHLGFPAGSRAAVFVEEYLASRWPNAGREIRFILKKI